MRHEYDIALFETILMDIYPLKFKPVIRLCDRIQFEGDMCFGLYQGFYYSPRKYKHLISISKKDVNNSLQLFATLAHEYAHAYQNENDLELDHDSFEFLSYKLVFMSEYQIDITTMEHIES